MAEHDAHGSSLAAWTLVFLVSVGSLVIAMGVVLWNIWIGVVGVAIAVLGVAVGRLMSLAGLGSTPRGGAAKDTE